MTIYKNRYQARKNAKYGDVVVKVEGGYIVMGALDYRAWKKMKKYSAHLVSLENGLPAIAKGRWENVEALKHDMEKDGYIVVNVWEEE